MGNFNGSGSWASGNDLALLLISSEGGASNNNNVNLTTFDNSESTMLDPTLQINLGNTSKRFSVGVVKAPANATALNHRFSNLGFTAVGTDDSYYASVSASIVPSASVSATPLFMFKANNTNNNNTDSLSSLVIVKSTIPATTKSIYLQLYNWDTPGWETKDTESAVAADTEVTLTSGTVTGSTAYYRAEASGGTCNGTGNDCWATWRVYQDAATDSSNQIFYADLFTPTFVPEKVLWLIPLAFYLPRIIQWVNRRRRLGYL